MTSSPAAFAPNMNAAVEPFYVIPLVVETAVAIRLVRGGRAASIAAVTAGPVPAAV